jgi:ABC-type oligopeptide transport system substrate-binding subunit
MSRRIRSLLSLVLVSFALTAAACADASGPSSETTCDNNNPVTCK